MMSTIVRHARLPAASVKQLAFLRQYDRLRRAILRRDQWQCRHCEIRLGDRLHVHHVVKRSHNKRLRLHEDNLVSLCQVCHDWTDKAFASSTGRLVITPKGGGQFEFEIVKTSPKWTPPAA